MADGTIQTIRHDIVRKSTSSARFLNNTILRGVEGLSFDKQEERFNLAEAVTKATTETQDEAIFGLINDARQVIATRRRESLAVVDENDEDSAEDVVDDGEPDFPEVEKTEEANTQA